MPLAPRVTAEDKQVIENIAKITAYLTGQTGNPLLGGNFGKVHNQILSEVCTPLHHAEAFRHPKNMLRD